MEVIFHRRNTIEQLVNTDTSYGIEVDIRSYNSNLIIHHDPFSDGVLFEQWLAHFNHGTLILNVKEEGLESKLIDLMSAHKISNYFFLDQSFPFLIKWSKAGESNCAIRFSEYESLETALALSGSINWVWVDCFKKFPLTIDVYKQLKNANFKLCVVSPELQGRNDEIEIFNMAKIINKNNMEIDAVCTKYPDLWSMAMVGK